MHAVVDHPHAQEQGGRDQAVGDHLENAAGHTLHGRRENAHGDKAHMRDRGIGDELLHILLHQRHQRGVDHRYHREREDERRQLVRGNRKHRQRETQEAIAAHLQENGGQDDRSRGRRLDMRVGEPRVHRPHRQLHRERGKEGKPCPGLQAAGEAVPQQCRNVGRAGIPVHRHDGEQHQHRSQQRIKKELEARIDPARTAPDANDQEHGNEAAFEKKIEHDEIERGKGAHHQRLQHQKGNHVFLHAVLDGLPARYDADRHQRGGENDEGQRDAVDPHVVGDGCAEPGLPLHELKLRRTRVEAVEQDQRNGEGDERRPQRYPARIAPLGLAVAAHGNDEQGADNGQEGRDGQDRPAHAQPTRPPNMNHVMKAATPISMAKA